jgi:hypothetical protein
LKIGGVGQEEEGNLSSPPFSNVHPEIPPSTFLLPLPNGPDHMLVVVDCRRQMMMMGAKGTRASTIGRRGGDAKWGGHKFLNLFGCMQRKL